MTDDDGMETKGYPELGWCHWLLGAAVIAFPFLVVWIFGPAVG